MGRWQVTDNKTKTMVIQYATTGEITVPYDGKPNISEIRKLIPEGSRWSRIEIVEDLGDDSSTFCNEVFHFCEPCGIAIMDGDEETPAYFGEDAPDAYLCDKCAESWRSSEDME